MKCRRCRAHAVIELPRHNAAFCSDCFFLHCERQVVKAIEDHEMIDGDDRVLIGISGGKDSLALWHILKGVGIEADGLYLNLGIGDYSVRSGELARKFAEANGLELKTVDLVDQVGFDIPGGARSARRPTCSVCGLSKRHLLNREARVGGYDIVATGHNLDDESATLLGNLLHWQNEYVARQAPTLPDDEAGFVKKVKPLVRLGEKETAAYCVLRGIDYVVDECPMVGGNTGLAYKEALSVLEATSPGTRQMFLYGFYERGRDLFPPAMRDIELVSCAECGCPTPASGDPVSYCAFCKMRRQAIRTQGGAGQEIRAR